MFRCWTRVGILTGAVELVWPVRFWPDHFFGIPVPWHTSTAKAPLYTSLKLLPAGCDVPNQAWTYMCFPRRNQDGHGNHKAVAVKHKGAVRAHPDNWKMKAKKISCTSGSFHCSYTPLCTAFGSCHTTPKTSRSSCINKVWMEATEQLSR